MSETHTPIEPVRCEVCGIEVSGVTPCQSQKEAVTNFAGACPHYKTKRANELFWATFNYLPGTGRQLRASDVALYLDGAIEESRRQATESGFHDEANYIRIPEMFTGPIDKSSYQSRNRPPAHLLPLSFYVSTKIMLVVTELAEAVEILRNDPYAFDDKVPAPSLQVELADAIIRLMDLMGWLHNLKHHPDSFTPGEIIVLKMLTNRERPRKHGKRF